MALLISTWYLSFSPFPVSAHCAVSHLWWCPNCTDLLASKLWMLMPAGTLLMLEPGASSSGCQRGCPLVSSKSLSLEGVSSACYWPACFQGGNSQCFLLEEWTPHVSSLVKWVRTYCKGCSRHFLWSTRISLDLTISVHGDLTFYCQHLRFFSWGLFMLPKTMLLTSMAAGNESRD